MSVHSSRHRGETQTIEHDHEHWPEGHYRGRGNRQDHTGPSGPFLEGAPAEHMLPPDVDRAPGDEPPAREEPAPESAAAHLAKRVREALSNHGDIDASKIEVVVDDDYVVLRGTVRSHWAYHYAGSLTRAVDGVASIDNQLVIERTEDARDIGGPTTDARPEQLPKKHFP